MSAPLSLERVRRKVEAGETLSDAELSLLRAEAQRDAGPVLRLALAHALVNAGAERDALPLLESLRRDFPRDLPVRLGLARALLGLERHGDAERLLTEVLAQSPDDPEVLKVLAVLGLRRGETDKARAYVADALARDPFDAEARLLKEELEAVDLPPPPVPQEQVLRPEFTAALTAALGRARVVFRRQGKDLLVKLATGGVGRVDVGSLYAAYLEAPGSQGLTAHAEALAAQLGGLSSGLGEEGASLEARLRPVLRPAGFEARAVGALHRPGPAGLEIFYVLEDAEFVRYLPESALAPAGLTPDSADAAAWRNLSSHVAKVGCVLIDQGQIRPSKALTGLWAVAEGDGHDAARLLLAPQRQALAELVGEGPYLVSLARREWVLVCLESDAKARASLARLVPSPDGIPGTFRLTEEGLSPV
ncbi:Tetratricopeptide repeat domain protein [Myxococcus hansupus]|uniref:Tetratricopeptide repeat domain protein n=1 Tax=Pseudomyxococcus hansupus TaxID=1297742 RepID=A0A0H4X716_9BACT|nr:tetratricopeptide repeat protein [Myxococcus hansupus]AKQ63657.1 Tetratricopeptide repeat domain protein [Myxococcus hansupus]